jgi:hypothetical protein
MDYAAEVPAHAARRRSASGERFSMLRSPPQHNWAMKICGLVHCFSLSPHWITMSTDAHFHGRAPLSRFTVTEHSAPVAAIAGRIENLRVSKRRQGNVAHIVTSGQAWPRRQFHPSHPRKEFSGDLFGAQCESAAREGDGRDTDPAVPPAVPAETVPSC